MPFRLRRDARRWFQDIERNFKVDFDIYYFCLMAGLAYGARNSDVKGSDATDLVDNFPGPYREQSRLIIAMFLESELRRMGIAISDREAVNRYVNSMVDPMAPSQLSENGLRKLNEISFGGFDVLSEYFEDRPRSTEAFLLHYEEFIRKSHES